MKITDIKCAVIASSPVIRVTTDEGITGWSQIETPKPYLQPIVLQLKSWLVGEDPVNVERVMDQAHLGAAAELQGCGARNTDDGFDIFIRRQPRMQPSRRAADRRIKHMPQARRAGARCQQAARDIGHGAVAESTTVRSRPLSNLSCASCAAADR